MTKDVWGVITLFFLGTIVVLIVTHAKGFSTSAGTVFTGINNLGTTLTGQRIKGGQLCVIVICQKLHIVREVLYARIGGRTAS